MAAPTQHVFSATDSEIKKLDGMETSIRTSDQQEISQNDGKSKQDLLDTIQKLQGQLTALQKAQESMPIKTSSSASQDGNPSSTSSQDQEGAGSSKKRTAQGWEQIEGTSFSGLRSDGKKKGKKVKKLKTFDFTRYNKRHVALLIAYLGWDYHGFASQITTENTIEAHLFDGLIKTRLIESRETSNYSRCGRTDKGVSAFGQVIALDLRSNLLEGHGVIQRSDNGPSERPGEKNVEIDYPRYLNRVLPEHIRVLAWSPVDVNFSARFDCRHRTYKYFFPKGDLDIEVMQEAALKLVGQHDFRNLCKMDVANGVVNFVRRILDVEISPVDERPGGYQMYTFQVRGQAFLYHQVRCMMAILFLIGQHREKPEILDRLLDIEKQPCKPQYSMAVDYPLVLYNCEFDGVNWMYDKDELEVNMKKLQTMWCNYAIKASTLTTMLNDLVKRPIPCQAQDNTSQGDSDVVPWSSTNSPLLKQNTALIMGTYHKTHKPLLERPVADSLEDRIKHYSKKFKMDDSANT
ncbi:tRNA pseudouridine(38/39) synthase-like isoform X2 [Amphiura filiformis]|uniref:tRNA pseudouridine(38/39) synthase-like isoform X2 n=1 Tax=Amphiura filiformis TaxID=82378 RepID=UPI003B21DA15